jgi:hypothetical protein
MRPSQTAEATTGSSATLANDTIKGGAGNDTD